MIPTYSSIYSRCKGVQRAPFFTLGAWLPRLIHVPHTALTNIGITYHTCITSFLFVSFLSVFVILLSLSIDLGRLVGLVPLRHQKNYPSRLSNVIADPVVVRDGHRMPCFVASLLYVSHCILISIARLVDCQ